MCALARVLVLGAALYGLPCLAAEKIVLESPSKIVVQGISAQALQAAESGSLKLFVDGTTSIPILGRGYVDGHSFVFEPRYPLRPGAVYRARFQPTELEVVLQLPAAGHNRATSVVKVYPTSDRVPENLLKFYLHFSEPMSRGGSYRHITLLDEADQPVNLPFIELAEELWDEQQQRLTLLLDPGRIKRGLKPNVEAGPPLVAGQRYTLVVANDWQDANRQPLGQGFRKRFQVTSFDDTQPDPNSWLISAPKGDSRNPLTVTLGEPLDSALLERCLTVVQRVGTEIVGDITLANNETEWRFVPQQPWQKGQYVLRIDTSLEDLAGNSIQRPFEVRGSQPMTITPQFVERSFEIE